MTKRGERSSTTSARRVTLDAQDDDDDDDSLRLSSLHHGDDEAMKTTPITPYKTPHPIQSPPYSPTDWKREYQILRLAYLKQEKRCEYLQEENDRLHQLVLNEETPPSKTKSKRKSFSPGQQFVAELCETMELDVGHHALLASIIDRQEEDKQRK